MYKIILALRYLIRRRITYFAVLAVALCVFIVVVVMTVMTGLVGTFKQANHEFVGDCVVGTKSLVGFTYYDEFLAELDNADFVAGTSPVINSYGLLSPKTGDINRGVEITPEVADGPNSVILEQVNNGIAVRMAALWLTSGAQERSSQSSM